MATKTVVCPECGAPAAPGRYACAECGSLLAAVTANARAWGSEPGPGTEPEAEPDMTADGTARDGSAVPVAAPPPTAPVGLAVGALAPSAPATEVAAEDWDEPVAGAPVEPEPEPEPQPEPGPASVADQAPSGQDADPVTVASAVEPDVLHGWTPHEGARTEPAWADDPASDAEPSPAEPLTPSASPAWPPAGDRGVDPTPAARIPAGAYLPPSAVLDAIDPAHAAAATPASITPATAGSRGTPSASSKTRSLLGSIDLADNTPRAVIAVGAALAAIGFLLPWANVLAGAGLLGGYFTQWGLAGPGHWIALTLLVATVGIALAGSPTARWPVGLGAIALAALLVGMMWPYLFGYLGRSIGIWVVLAGSIVLVIGGVLDRLGRHDPDGPAVP